MADQNVLEYLGHFIKFIELINYMFQLFLIIALAIFIGFLATLIFERTRISQVLILILFGILLGPGLNLVDVTPDSIIVSLLPFLATLALIVLLFDAGLMIDVFAVARAIPRSTLFTLFIFLLTVSLVSIFSTFALGWPLLHGILLGAVVGGTSSAIVIAMVERARISKETRSILTVESTITDALCIIVAVAALQLIISNHAPEPQVVISTLLSSFTLAVLFGLLSAVGWIFVIDRFSLPKCSYMLTLGLVLGLFAITDALGANGGIAVFIFGMVLGNAKELGKLLKFRKEVKINPNIRLFQEEITFFVRTFFFVYIGLLLSPAYFTPFILGISLALLILFLAARWIAQKLLLSDLSSKDRNIAMVMLPRGLAAAVLSTMPLTNGIAIPNFQQIVFVLILLSNIAATMGLFVFDKNEASKKTTKQKAEEILEEAVEDAELPQTPTESEAVDEAKETDYSEPEK